MVRLVLVCFGFRQWAAGPASQRASIASGQRQCCARCTEQCAGRHQTRRHADTGGAVPASVVGPSALWPPKPRSLAR